MVYVKMGFDAAISYIKAIKELREQGRKLGLSHDETEKYVEEFKGNIADLFCEGDLEPAESPNVKPRFGVLITLGMVAIFAIAAIVVWAVTL